MSTIIEKHKISLFSGILLCVTCMIGSGWLFSSQLAAQNAGNYAFLAWIVAAAIIISVGLCLSSVIAKHPERGATTRVSAISHNSIFGLPFAFANWFGISVVIATEAQATTQYLAPFLGDWVMNNGIIGIYGKFIGLALLCMYLLINWYGIKLMARINNIVTVLKIFTPLFVITILIVSHLDLDNFTQVSNDVYSSANIIPAIVASGMIYAFNGFQVVGAFASEIKNPKRNIPLAIIISVLVVLAFYLVLQFAFMGAMPSDKLANGWAGINMSSPIVGLTIILGLNFLMILLLADSVVAPSAVGYTYLGTSSRMLFAMSQEKQAPSFLSRHVNPKRGFSIPAMMTNFIIAVVFLFQAESWAGLMVIVTMLHIIGYMAAPISMSALNPKTRPFGLVVFVVVTVILLTISAHDILMTNIVISALSIIYMASQGIKNIKVNIIFGTPFILFLWILYFSQLFSGSDMVSNIIGAICAVIFFVFATDKRYVKICRAFRSQQLKGSVV